MRRFLPLIFLALIDVSPAASRAATFVLPTPNDAIYKGGGEAYFVGTVGRPWESGTFGCVRTDGRQMHEGLDIRCVQRDSKNEPMDSIFAVAAGRVAYINRKGGLSTYGIYIVLEHQIEGIPVFTVYAHLSRVEPGLETGGAVRQGQKIATMGRTASTRQGISKERAHLHFEVALRMNDRFASWHSSRLKGQRNDHGNFNGRNFAGLDPQEIFLEQKRLGERFSFLEFVRSRTELCRVLVRDTNFRWLRQYTPLILRNAEAEQKGAAAYEIALDFNGVPFQLVPRSAGELKSRGGANFELISVNEEEEKARGCRNLVIKRAGQWRLSNSGSQLLDLLTYGSY